MSRLDYFKFIVAVAVNETFNLIFMYYSTYELIEGGTDDGNLIEV